MHLEPLSQLRWAYHLHYYICFSTHRRHALFDSAENEAALVRCLNDVCSTHGYHLLEHKPYPDHLRCLLSLRPNDAVASVLKVLKGNLARLVCRELEIAPPLWAVGYLARSAGRVRIAAVRRYLADQPRHHGYSRRVRPPVFRYRASTPVVLKAAHASFELTHHLVLATRYRRGIFGAASGEGLTRYWLRVADKRGFAIDEASVLPDHVHLMVRIPPKLSIEECALSLMNNGQHWFAKRYAADLIRAGVDRLWESSAYAGTCGNMTTALIKSFLARKA